MREIIKNFTALIASIILVHLVYVLYVWPESSLLIAAAEQSGQAIPRSAIIIIKDYEQEICFILMLWGCFLIFDNYIKILRDNHIFNVDFIQRKENDTINPQEIINRLDAELKDEYQSSLLIQTLRMALWRYAGTHNIQNLSDAVESSLQALAVKQDAGNSMIRYLIWAIPSIGFVGTVRGIGQALSMADQALAGDISGMTNSLGVAFNSTFVALLISVFMMFLFHQLQRLQDGQILDTQTYCDKYLLAGSGPLQR